MPSVLLHGRAVSGNVQPLGRIVASRNMFVLVVKKVVKLIIVLVQRFMFAVPPIQALNESHVVTSTYEVLEPETWVGQKLPIL